MTQVAWLRATKLDRQIGPAPYQEFHQLPRKEFHQLPREAGRTVAPRERSLGGRGRFRPNKLGLNLRGPF